MALTVLGPAVDLHAGGADLRFPHHAYQAAMAEAVTGVRPFARAAMHVGTVRVGGARMAKSTGNLVLVADVVAKHPPAALRLLLLDRPWAADWDYDPAALDEAAGRLARLYAAASHGAGESDPVAVGAVRAALLDDLDVPTALDVAEESGGAGARLALTVLGLA
jgi:cysteinyl-tRNA synthetase